MDLLCRALALLLQFGDLLVDLTHPLLGACLYLSSLHDYYRITP
jgi:hypothetical protein